MNDNQLTALINLIDAKIALAFAEREVGSDGYTGSAISEHEAVQVAELNLRRELGTE